MQFWIHFDAGAGGDGFANLLEQAQEITTLDQSVKTWRLNCYVDGGAKFYAPNFDLNGCFRQGPRPFLLNEPNQLSSAYVDIISSNKSTVCTSHDLTLKQLNQSDCLDIITVRQIKILLENVDPRISYRSGMIKNFKLGSLIPTPAWVNWNVNMDRSKFDYVLDATKIKNDWNYVNNFCQQVGLTLEEIIYRKWQSLLNKNQDSAFKEYKSIIENNIVIGYNEIN
jgi:hypothetical protein